MKKTLAAVLSLIMVISLAACTSPPPQSVSPGSVSPPIAADGQTLASGVKIGAKVALADVSYNDMGADELYELAKKETSTIVVYSETSTISKAVDKFLLDYPGLKVDHYTLTPSEIQEKVDTEHQTKNITADVLIINDAAGTIYNEWYEDGYVEAYYPTDVIKHIPDAKLENAMPLYEALNIWFYNTDQFPDGCPVNSWWDIIEVDEDNNQKYRIFCKDISGDTSYMSFYANMLCYSAELEQAYADKYGKPLEYTYDPNTVPVEANNAAYEFLYRLAQLEVGYISDGDEIVQAVAESPTPALGFATANKLAAKTANNWPLAWITQMAPYASTSNPKNLYMVAGTENPAGARLLMYYLLGGKNGDTASLAVFSRLGTWFMRDDYADPANEISLDKISIVNLNMPKVYDTYLDINDFWIYWSDFYAK